MWIEPIFDRTAEDVEYAKAHRDSSEPLKGARNYQDLNRIAGNIRYLAERIEQAGFAAPELLSKDDWTMTDIPRESDIDNIRTDLLNLRAMMISPGMTEVPELPYTHYAKLNSAERLLYEMEQADIRPQILVTVPTGASVTCTDGVTALAAISVNDRVVFIIPNFGEWTLSATLDGAESNIETVTVESATLYTAALLFFFATMTITVDTGALVTATSGEYVLTATSVDGVAVITTRIPGTYSISAVLNDAPSSTASASVITSGGDYLVTLSFITLTVIVDANSIVTVENGSTTLSGTSKGTIKFYLPNIGIWSVTASLTPVKTATGNVSAMSFIAYTLTLEFPKALLVEFATPGTFEFIVQNYIKSNGEPLQIGDKIDIYMVGGGGGGASGSSIPYQGAPVSTSTAGGGGGGGQCILIRDFIINNLSYSMSVGNGGGRGSLLGGGGDYEPARAGSAGGNTSAFGYTVNGGSGGGITTGGNGGSGGGGGTTGTSGKGGDGGSGGGNGGSGSPSSNVGGIGAGSITYQPINPYDGITYGGGGGGGSIGQGNSGGYGGGDHGLSNGSAGMRGGGGNGGGGFVSASNSGGNGGPGGGGGGGGAPNNGYAATWGGAGGSGIIIIYE